MALFIRQCVANDLTDVARVWCESWRATGIDPDRRPSIGDYRQRLGQALLNVAKREMPAGFWLRTDAVNTAARRFYERAGMALAELGSHPAHGQDVATYIWPRQE